jgi:UDP-2,4-diacetamido-2,4,6-trideoxy-beta-L-altropyranose hydrolase
MKIVIIVHGNLKIGMGHVSRCLTFATELKNKAEIIFIPNYDETIIDYIRKNGFAVLECKNHVNLLTCLKELDPNVLIIDKLDVEENLARALKEALKTRLVILGNLTGANKYADIVVNDIVGQFKDHEVRNLNYMDRNTNTLYFWGPKYVILRREFFQWKKRARRFCENVEKILLTFGGSDPSNLTGLVLNELLKSDHQYKITIVLGIKFGALDELRHIIEMYPYHKKNITLFRNTNNLGELMYMNDLVICSLGTSLFEALCVGTPVIGINQNSLQKRWAQGLFSMLDKAQVSSVRNIIDNAGYISPNSELVWQMEIGEGIPEVIETILRE